MAASTRATKVFLGTGDVVSSLVADPLGKQVVMLILKNDSPSRLAESVRSGLENELLQSPSVTK